MLFWQISANIYYMHTLNHISIEIQFSILFSIKEDMYKNAFRCKIIKFDKYIQWIWLHCIVRNENGAN